MSKPKVKHKSQVTTVLLGQPTPNLKCDDPCDILPPDFTDCVSTECPCPPHQVCVKVQFSDGTCQYRCIDHECIIPECQDRLIVLPGTNKTKRETHQEQITMTLKGQEVPIINCDETCEPIVILDTSCIAPKCFGYICPEDEIEECTDSEGNHYEWGVRYEWVEDATLDAGGYCLETEIDTRPDPPECEDTVITTPDIDCNSIYHPGNFTTWTVHYHMAEHIRYIGWQPPPGNIVRYRVRHRIADSPWFAYTSAESNATQIALGTIQHQGVIFEFTTEFTDGTRSILTIEIVAGYGGLTPHVISVDTAGCGSGTGSTKIIKHVHCWDEEECAWKCEELPPCNCKETHGPEYACCWDENECDWDCIIPPECDCPEDTLCCWSDGTDGEECKWDCLPWIDPPDDCQPFTIPVFNDGTNGEPCEWKCENPCENDEDWLKECEHEETGETYYWGKGFVPYLPGTHPECPAGIDEPFCCIWEEIDTRPECNCSEGKACCWDEDDCLWHCLAEEHIPDCDCDKRYPGENKVCCWDKDKCEWDCVNPDDYPEPECGPGEALCWNNGIDGECGWDCVVTGTPPTCGPGQVPCWDKINCVWTCKIKPPCDCDKRYPGENRVCCWNPEKCRWDCLLREHVPKPNIPCDGDWCWNAEECVWDCWVDSPGECIPPCSEDEICCYNDGTDGEECGHVCVNIKDIEPCPCQPDELCCLVDECYWDCLKEEDHPRPTTACPAGEEWCWSPWECEWKCTPIHESCSQQLEDECKSRIKEGYIWRKNNQYPCDCVCEPCPPGTVVCCKDGENCECVSREDLPECDCSHLPGTECCWNELICDWDCISPGADTCTIAQIPSWDKWQCVWDCQDCPPNHKRYLNTSTGEWECRPLPNCVDECLQDEYCCWNEDNWTFDCLTENELPEYNPPPGQVGCWDEWICDWHYFNDPGCHLSCNVGVIFEYNRKLCSCLPVVIPRPPCPEGQLSPWLDYPECRWDDCKIVERPQDIHFSCIDALGRTNSWGTLFHWVNEQWTPQQYSIIYSRECVEAGHVPQIRGDGPCDWSCGTEEGCCLIGLRLALPETSPPVLHGCCIFVTHTCNDPEAAIRGTIDWGSGTSEPYLPWQEGYYHIYPGPGTYTITVTVTQGDDCPSFSESVEIVIAQPQPPCNELDNVHTCTHAVLGETYEWGTRRYQDTSTGGCITESIDTRPTRLVCSNSIASWNVTDCEWRCPPEIPPPPPPIPEYCFARLTLNGAVYPAHKFNSPIKADPDDVWQVRIYFGSSVYHFGIPGSWLQDGFIYPTNDTVYMIAIISPTGESIQWNVGAGWRNVGSNIFVLSGGDCNYVEPPPREKLAVPIIDCVAQIRGQNGLQSVITSRVRIKFRTVPNAASYTIQAQQRIAGSPIAAWNAVSSVAHTAESYITREVALLPEMQGGALMTGGIFIYRVVAIPAFGSNYDQSESAAAQRHFDAPVNATRSLTIDLTQCR